MVESELSPGHSGFANPLYNQDDAAAAAAAAETGKAGDDDDDRDERPSMNRGFKPASDESGNDTLQLVERDVDE